MQHTESELAIIGGGICGLTTAIALAGKGITVPVFEAAPQFSAVGAGIGLAPNALLALEHINMLDSIREIGFPLTRFAILDEQGNCLSRNEVLPDRNNQRLNNITLHRADLHNVLVSRLKPENLHTGKRLKNIRQSYHDVLIEFEDGSTHKARYLIAAEGIHSPVRKQLFPDSGIRFAGYACWRAVVNLPSSAIPPLSSETWGSKGRFGIFPLTGNRLYWFACINSPTPEYNPYRHYTINDLLRHFSGYHAPVTDSIAQARESDLIQNDIYDLVPLKNYASHNILLIGDAAHATTPNMGQGACQAIEDAVLLADELHKTLEVPAAFRNFEQKRLKRTQKVIKQSRLIGRIAQLDSPLLIRARNFGMRISPAWLYQTQVRFLNEIDFN